MVFQKRYVVISWMMAVFVWFFIFYTSSLTFATGGGTGYLSYIYHFSVFFAFAFFLLVASLQGRFKKEIFALVIILAIVYGISDEFHQYFVPGRYYDYKDMLLDGAGAMGAGIVYIAALLVNRLLQSHHLIQNNAEDN
ncbi:MAG: VanZ like family [archaeon]|jgi:glucan phosphoethanolaminetransferase (alkaline phosphatase superfamily)